MRASEKGTGEDREGNCQRPETTWQPAVRCQGSGERGGESTQAAAGTGSAAREDAEQDEGIGLLGKCGDSRLRLSIERSSIWEQRSWWLPGFGPLAAPAGLRPADSRRRLSPHKSFWQR